LKSNERVGNFKGGAWSEALPAALRFVPPVTFISHVIESKAALPITEGILENVVPGRGCRRGQGQENGQETE